MVQAAQENEELEAIQINFSVELGSKLIKRKTKASTITPMNLKPGQRISASQEAIMMRSSTLLDLNKDENNYMDIEYDTTLLVS